MRQCKTCSAELKAYQKLYCSRSCYWADPAQRERAARDKRGSKNPWFGTGGPMKGRRHTDAHKRYMSEKFSGVGNPFYGKKHSEEYKARRIPGSTERKARYRAVAGFLWNAVRHIGKDDDTVIVKLGYSPQQLADHLFGLFQPGMTWENHGRQPGCWQIDHVRPVATFPMDTPMSVINELKNLQPMWMTENLSKGKKWDGRQDKETR